MHVGAARRVYDESRTNSNRCRPVGWYIEPESRACRTVGYAEAGKEWPHHGLHRYVYNGSREVASVALARTPLVS